MEKFKSLTSRRRYSVSAIIASMVVNTLCSAVAAWALMLGVSLAHSHWVRDLPTIGYLVAFAITGCVRLFVAMLAVCGDFENEKPR